MTQDGHAAADDTASISDIGAIVLAAGLSSRFGSDKLAYPLVIQGVERSVLAHSLLPWCRVFNRVTVVVGHHRLQLQRQVEDELGETAVRHLEWHCCPDAGQGMAYSLRCGIAANHAAQGWLFGLGDMPWVPESAIVRVRNALRAGAIIAAPYHQQKRGHPVGFSQQLRDDLLELTGDQGARPLLQRHASKIERLDESHAGVLMDIDLPSDIEGQRNI